MEIGDMTVEVERTRDARFRVKARGRVAGVEATVSRTDVLRLAAYLNRMAEDDREAERESD